MAFPTLLRRAGFAAALITGLTLGGAAAAQALPDALRFVVPFPAGGTADVLPRLMADKLRPQFSGGVIVENRTGAGGNIGADVAFRADPDGRTLLASPPGPIAINHHLYPRLSFDPTKWVPVTILATVPNVLVVSSRVQAKTVQEFIAYAKANPGKVTFASQGNGSTSHLTAGLFMRLTGTEMVHVPYKGTAPALVDMLGGQVDIFFDNLSSSMGHHRSGKLRILAVADEQRSEALPDVPTFAEAGLAGMNAVTWFGVVAPPGTPADLANRYQGLLAEVLKQDDVRQRFAEQGAVPRGWSTQRTGDFIRAESEKWNGVIKSANIRLE